MRCGGDMRLEDVGVELLNFQLPIETLDGHTSECEIDGGGARFHHHCFL